MTYLERLIDLRTTAAGKVVAILISIMLTVATISIVSVPSQAWADEAQNVEQSAGVEEYAAELQTPTGLNEAAAVVDTTESDNDTDATVDAAATDADEQIDDEANALASFELENQCWIHWILALGIIATALYGYGVVNARRKEIAAMQALENQALGRTATTNVSAEASAQKI